MIIIRCPDLMDQIMLCVTQGRHVRGFNLSIRLIHSEKATIAF